MLFPTIGIVAEYNPLHKGHLHHLEQAKELTGARAAVVVLSSNFVQRGEAAIMNKHQRAETALKCGADLILELPLPYSSHNAGVFANAAVDILGATKVVSHIAYGAESPDWQTDRILDILIHEPEPFKLFLKEELKKGKSFVQSRADALDFIIPGTASHLKGSNNTLALSYLLRIKRKNWNMIPVPIHRIGSSYNDENLSEISSATAIRRAVAAGDEAAFGSMPASSAEVLKRALKNGRACTETNRMWLILRSMLLRSSAEEISKYAEIGEGIEFLMKSSALAAKSYEDWVASCVSKRYPRGRIQRQAVHFMTGLSHWDNRAFQRVGPPYIRVLGMNDIGRELLRNMKKCAILPVITRCGAAAGISEYAKKMMDYELVGSEMWESFVSNPEFGREHARSVIKYTE